MNSDSISIETIQCEDEEKSQKDIVLSSSKQLQTDCLENIGADNHAFVIEESEYSKEPLRDRRPVDVNGFQEQETEEEKARQKWSNPLEFLLSCISMSVSC